MAPPALEGQPALFTRSAGSASKDSAETARAPQRKQMVSLLGCLFRRLVEQWNPNCSLIIESRLTGACVSLQRDHCRLLPRPLPFPAGGRLDHPEGGPFVHSSSARRTRRVVASFWQNLGKMLLVFGCIGTDFCKKICVLQHFSKSTRFSS